MSYKINKLKKEKFLYVKRCYFIENLESSEIDEICEVKIVLKKKKGDLVINYYFPLQIKESE